MLFRRRLLLKPVRRQGCRAKTRHPAATNGLVSGVNDPVKTVNDKVSASIAPEADSSGYYC
ncbi:MAG: hypothetical protein IPH18_12150 [Chitinophagaceae bacterium]|nr:hypothetical protein [Chitinophagaceae bacterium]